MGTLTSLEALYDNIAKVNQNLDATEIRSETERYMTTAVTGISSLETFYQLFDDAFPGSPSVHRFSKAERAQRKQTSATLRRAMTNYAATYASTRNEPGTEPWLQCLLFPTKQDDEIYGQMNQERMAQFLPDTPAGQQYKQNTIENIKRRNPGMSQEDAAAQFEQDILKTRGGIVEFYVKEAAEVMKKLDEMAGPNVSPENLAINLGKIMGAKRINDSIEKYLELADSGFIQLSEETRQLMQQQIHLRPRLTMATNKLESMANPMYEYFDVDRFGPYDMEAMKKVWDDFCAEESPNWKAKKSRKHSHFNTYVTPEVHDDFSCFMENAAGYAAARREMSERQHQEIISNYSFETRLTSKYSEVPTSRDSKEKKQKMERMGADHTLDGIKNLNLYNDKPTAYVQGFRVVITSPAENFSGITVERPETLYNYSLNGTAANLAKTLEDADRWYKTNKHGYGDMRETLKKITKLGKLPKDFTEQDIQKRKELYSSLLQSSHQYLDSKGGKVGKNDVEEKRINAANKVESFAAIKLKELEMIKGAKKTLERYRDVAPENLREVTARENGTPEMKKAIRDLDKNNREEDPVEWLEKLYSKKYLDKVQLPKNLTQMLTKNLSDLGIKWNGKNIFEDNQTHDCFELSLGATAAAEMILAERKRMGKNGGPVEARLEQVTKDELISLGVDVYEKQTKNAVLSAESVNNALLSYDPQVEPNQYIKEDSFLKPALFRQDLMARYLNTIEPTGDKVRDEAFQSHVNTYILDSADQHYNQMSGPLKDAQDILANCVLHDVILLERSGNPGAEPGSIEQQMQNAPNELVEQIKNSPKFQRRLTDLDNLKVSPLEVLVGGEIKQFAKEYIEFHNKKVKGDPLNNEKNKVSNLQNSQKNEIKVDSIKNGADPKSKQAVPIT